MGKFHLKSNKVPILRKFLVVRFHLKSNLVPQMRNFSPTLLGDASVPDRTILVYTQANLSYHFRSLVLLKVFDHLPPLLARDVAYFIAALYFIADEAHFRFSLTTFDSSGEVLTDACIYPFLKNISDYFLPLWDVWGRVQLQLDAKLFISYLPPNTHLDRAGRGGCNSDATPCRPSKSWGLIQ